MLAYRLACKNLRVLLIEKEKLPRYKPCGGGLTKRALGILPFDMTGLMEDHIFKAEISLNNHVIVQKTTTYPMFSTVMRDQFDAFLVEKAVNAGADLRENTGFQSLSGPVGDLKLETSRGTFLTRVIVGADGARSTVARALGLWKRRAFMTALVAEVFYENGTISKKLRNTVYWDFGMIPKGYGWVFPKKGHLSVGILSHSKRLKNSRSLLETYMKTKGLHSGGEVKSLRGHLIPFGPQGRILLANQNGLLVGDAAGLTDAVTGEGIYYALREAEMASKVISNSLEVNSAGLEEYNTLINKELVKELTYAKRLGYVLYSYPLISHRVLKAKGQRLVEYQLEVMLGARTYKDLYHKMIRRTLPALLGASDRGGSKSQNPNLKF